MAWRVKGVMDQRIEFVVRAVSGEERISGLCREFGISRVTGYHWIRRYREEGTLAGLVEQSRRPHRSPQRTSTEVEDRVLEKRLTYGWGARKLQVLLREEGLDLSERTINRILKRRGAQRPQDCHGRALKRFERARPNELWQMDFKGEYLLRGGGCCYPLSILDDHSRFSVGLFALRHPSYESVRASVVSVFQAYGVPEAMLMDHGSPWWGTANRVGLTRLSVDLMEQGIDLCWSALGHPQTQGKVERFHRSLSAGIRHRGGPPQHLQQWAPLLADFRQEYNQVRPHEALGMQVPAQRYESSRRAYRARPRPWDYGKGLTVVRVGFSGNIAWQGHHYFISNALNGKWVGIQPVEDRVLVRYRKMCLCEIDLRTGRVRSLLEPVPDGTRWKRAAPGGGPLPSSPTGV